MPSIWTYSDNSDRGYGIFKRRSFHVLRELGWQTYLAEAPLLEEGSKALLRKHLFDHPCDWIFLINQTASQFYDYLNVSGECRPLPCKKICWFLDNPQFFITHPLEEEEYPFSFDETYLETLQSFSTRAAGFMPLACDHSTVGRFNPKFSCEVSFVGGVIDQSSRRNQLPPQMVEYTDTLVEKKLEHRNKSFEELSLLYPIAPGKQIKISNDVAHFLYWEANNRYRIRVLESLMDFDLRIYGNEDWELMLKDSPLQKFFFGPADPVKDLPDIFVSSKINLNLHSIQCLGSLNQRDFNAPVCGGFLLSDWVPAAGRYFEPGSEAVYWSDTQDLRQKIAYYLNYPEERDRIIKSGKENVLNRHTYHHRIKNLLSIIS